MCRVHSLYRRGLHLERLCFYTGTLLCTQIEGISSNIYIYHICMYVKCIIVYNDLCASGIHFNIICITNLRFIHDYIMYTVHCTVYNVQCTMYNVQSYMYIVHLTLHPILYDIYIVYCIQML